MKLVALYDAVGVDVGGRLPGDLQRLGRQGRAPDVLRRRARHCRARAHTSLSVQRTRGGRETRRAPLLGVSAGDGARERLGTIGKATHRPRGSGWSGGRRAVPSPPGCRPGRRGCSACTAGARSAAARPRPPPRPPAPT